MKGLAAALLLFAVATPALAHPLAPGLLELRQTAAERYVVTWRTTVVRGEGGLVEPRLPQACAPTSPVESRVEDGGQVSRWTVACTGALAGQAIAVDRLDGSGINVIVRVAPLGGPAFEALLGADRPSAVVDFARPGAFGRYFLLGMEHLVTGADHLLFLLGLFLLVSGVKRLVATVTAFTLGHSLTLALSVLGYVPLKQAYAELMIAATVLVLALELTRGEQGASLVRRLPWVMAGTFGLVHGLGFAGALRDVGLPGGDIPAALLAFNLGIECAQLAIVAGLLAAAVALRRLPPPLVRWAPLAPAYLLGSMAACWVLERSAALLA